MVLVTHHNRKRGICGVFVSDSLTRDNQQLLYRARQLKREQKIFAAWSDVGKLKVRVRQGGPTHVIRSTRDLLKLVDNKSTAPVPAESEAPGAPRRPGRERRGQGRQT